MTVLPPPRLETPPLACDTHLHIFDARFPLAAPGPTAMPDAPLAAYQAVQRRLGLQRAVIVQANGYRTDHRCMIEAMRRMGPDTARGVAIVTPDTPPEDLAGLSAEGVRGARFHMLGGGLLAWDDLPAIAARIQDFGWHSQLQLDGRTLPAHLDRIRRLPGRIVIDHVGKFLEPVSPQDPAFLALLGLVDSGRVWVKLSAPYEVSKSGPPGYDDVGALARALVRAAPERMLWASNWPHPWVAADPDNADLLDLLLDWAPDPADRRRILVDNPADIYGF